VQTLIKLFQEWRGIEKIKGIKRQVSRTQSVDKMLQQPNSERWSLFGWCKITLSSSWSPRSSYEYTEVMYYLLC